MLELKIIKTEIKISLEGFNSKYKLSWKRISKHKLYPQRFCKPTNQEKKEHIKIKSFLKSHQLVFTGEIILNNLIMHFLNSIQL